MIHKRFSIDMKYRMKNIYNPATRIIPKLYNKTTTKNTWEPQQEGGIAERYPKKTHILCQTR